MSQPNDPKAVLLSLYRQDFRAFLMRCFPHIAGGGMLAWNWHHDAIAWELDRIHRGENRRLLVTMPPRNLKSIAISVGFVAYELGLDPTKNFVCVSYSAELAVKHARDCIAIMESEWYREIFPGTVISPKRSATYDFDTTVGGGRLSTSVGGTLTGRGGDIIIIDDPIKPDEAESEANRKRANEWFHSTLSSRLNDKATGAIIVVMQRLHQYDLAGMLLDAGGWAELKLPAIAREPERIQIGPSQFHERSVGEVLDQVREPREILDSMRVMMGPLRFEAQYQQEPAPAEGNIIKAEWLKFYPKDFDPARLAGQIVQSWDTASENGARNDHSVCITARVHKNDVYILDVFVAKLEFPQLVNQTIRLAREFRAKTLLIEKAASGMQLIQTLRADQPSGVPSPVPRKPETDKVSRVMGISGEVAAGRLHLPEEAPWLPSFTAELLGFPNARFDDQVDALTQLMDWVRQFRITSPKEIICGGMLFVRHADGSSEWIGEDAEYLEPRPGERNGPGYDWRKHLAMMRGLEPWPEPPPPPPSDDGIDYHGF